MRQGPPWSALSGGADTVPYGACRPLRKHLVVGFLFLCLALAPGQAVAKTRILALGDSLVAGYGLLGPDGFVPQLEAALRAAGLAVEIVNGGVSGDTSAGGLARLDWVLASDPAVVLVELGANDALRGLDPGETEANLDGILTRLKAEGRHVLLAGMEAPRNWGREYVEAFRALYVRLAAKHRVALYPFFLDGVAARPEFNQPDGIHPNARGVREIVGRIAPHLTRLVRDAETAVPNSRTR
jgi:acyl-CoA thioesterase I